MQEDIFALPDTYTADLKDEMDAIKASLAAIKPAEKVLLDLTKYTALLSAYEAGESAEIPNDTNDDSVWIIVAIILVAVAVLAGTGVGIYLFIKRKNKTEESKAKEESEAEEKNEKTEESETDNEPAAEEEVTEEEPEIIEEEIKEGDDAE